MLAIVTPEDAYELHVNLIRHGRAVCRPKPRCGECALRRMCPWYRENRAPPGDRSHARRRMSKRTFICFGLLILVLAVVIPWLVFRSKGDAETGDQEGPREPEERPVPLPDQLRHLPHALRGRHRRQLRADLDELLAPTGRRRRPRKQIKSTEGRVLNAVENGVDSSTTPGRMPGGILNEAAGRRSRRIRRPHRRRGLTDPAGRFDLA